MRIHHICFWKFNDERRVAWFSIAAKDNCWTGSCRGLMMRGEHLDVCPLPNLCFEECEKYRHRKTTCADLYHGQKDTKKLNVLNLKKTSPQVIINGIVDSAESVLTAPNDVLSEKFTVLLWSFLQQLKVKNLSPNRHAWYSSVTKFALPLKPKTSIQDTIET